MSTFQTGQWVRRGRNIVILLNSPRPAVEEETGTNDTAWVQRSLNSVMQAGLVVDGIMGPNTRAAITAFQRSEGLVADGIAGPITQAALQRRLTGPYRPAPAPTPSPPSSTVGTFDGLAVASWLIPYWRGRDRTAGGAGSTAAGALRNTARDYALRNAASRRALAPAPAAIPNTRPRQSRMGRSTSANTPSSASSWPAVRSGPASSTTCPTIASTSRRTVIDPGRAQDPP